MKILVVVLSSLVISFLLEVIYRYYKHNRLIIPSPYSLAMYVLTSGFLYGLYSLNINIFYKFIFIIIFTTGLEFLVGHYLKVYKKLILWSYSDRWLNYRGIICPWFSIYWFLISLFYYFLILPIILKYF